MQHKRVPMIRGCSWHPPSGRGAAARRGLRQFLIPPQLVAWDGTNAPAWAERLAVAAPYSQIRTIAARLGLYDDYALFGSLVAPSFLLIGIAVLLALGRTGRWTPVVGVLTIIGTPIVLLSYLGSLPPAPWKYFWGTEALLVLAIGLAAIPAGVLAYRHRRLGGWRAVLLACTIVVLIGGVALFNYWPHGCLVSCGVEVASADSPYRAEPVGARDPRDPAGVGSCCAIVRSARSSALGPG